MFDELDAPDKFDDERCWTLVELCGRYYVALEEHEEG